MATYQFQTEVNQLLKLIIHSMYSNKDIFLREIVSNASDALDKLKYLTVSDDNYKDIKVEPRIDISFDEPNKLLTVQDSGIGMNEEDLTANLGTIARSGTKAFIEKIANDKNAGESNLIGQFGVGFYSTFMVSSKVRVVTKRYGSQQAYAWESDGVEGYTIAPAQKETYGTDVILTIKPDTDQENYSRFLTEYGLKDLIKRYSNYVRYPIHMTVTKSRALPKPEDAGDDYVPELFPPL